MTPVTFSLGSNVGDKVSNIHNALDALDAVDGLFILEASPFYRTAPWGINNQDWFINICARGETSLSPHELLHATQNVEKLLGRAKTIRWGPRLIDIDILFFGDATYDHDDLTIPHKSMIKRAFVLVPLKDVLPDCFIGTTQIDDAISSLKSDVKDIIRLDYRRWEHKK